MNKLQEGRLDRELDKSIRINDIVTTWRKWIEDQAEFSCKESDGMWKWSRTRFNRLEGDEQEAYEKSLKSKTYYWINNVNVPKMIYDFVKAKMYDQHS